MSIDETHTVWTTYDSPLGPLTLIGGATGLREMRFPGRSADPDQGSHRAGEFTEVIRQLAAGPAAASPQPATAP